MDEFSLIDDFFKLPSARQDVILGVGDDAALLDPVDERELVMCMDTLVDGVHFPIGTDAADIAWKAVAVNLSDLAAMGAEPAWLSLALTMPQSDRDWLRRFGDGLRAACDEFDVALVGGDTTRGPLTITVHATGHVESGTAMRRDAARVGDHLCVSGDLGAAACALHQMQTGQVDAGCSARLNRPQPRVGLGRDLRGVSGCAIDVSDGLLADLGHVLDASGVGVTVDLGSVPVSSAVTDAVEADDALRLAMTGGDDYELLFTIAPAHASELEHIARRHDLPVSHIGVITETRGIDLQGSDAQLAAITEATTGYRHFG